MPLPRPQDLVFTLFGEYLLHRPGPVWVGSLIALLEPLGLSPGSSRTVLSRMTRKGWFRTAREGRNSFYSLTDRGRRLLQKGEARIYRPPRDEGWDGRWFLIAYSIPEDTRHLRDRLRVRLSWIGFGSLGNGLWISPHPVEDEVAEVARELEVEEHVEVFRARHLGPSDADRLVASCWDLAGVNDRYRDFLKRHGEAFRDARAAALGGGMEPEECYVRRFELIHEYREFPLVDPRLPRALLPEGWVGEEARELFQAYHELLEEPADRYVDQVLEEGRGADGRGGRAGGRGGRRRVRDPGAGDDAVNGAVGSTTTRPRNEPGRVR